MKTLFLKQKLFSLGDKFFVFDKYEENIYYFKGRILDIQNTIRMFNMKDEQLFYSKKKILSIMANYKIYSNDENVIMNIDRKFGWKPKFEIEYNNTQISIQGKWHAHDFQIFSGNKEIAKIEKKVFKIHDTYQIDILEEKMEPLIVFLVVIIDQVLHEKNKGIRRFI
jgi:uncharacterized protein YxjI